MITSKTRLRLSSLKLKNKLQIYLLKKTEKKVFDNFGELSNTDGTTNMNGIWGLKRKMFPKNSESLPISKRNSGGRLISSKKELMTLYLESFKHQLRHRPIKGNFVYLKQLKEKLYTQRLEIAKNRKTEPWKLDQLKFVLRSLKMGKSRDPHGLNNEVFKLEVIFFRNGE